MSAVITPTPPCGRAPTTPRGRIVAAAMIAVSLALTGCSSPSDPADAPTTSPAPPPVEGPAAPAGELDPALQARLQGVVEQTMAEYDAPGAVAGVWIPGEGSWTTAVGTADLADQAPVDVEMAWPLRSVTKSYTVTLILQLADEGALSLDDTIDQYVEGVTDGDTITLRQLAGMTSGNADYTNEEWLADFTADPERIFTLDELNGYVLGKPAQFAPGSERVYTNANTNLLGSVIQTVSGQSYAEVLHERILDPLGLDGTDVMPDPSLWRAPHPVGYSPVDGELVDQTDNMSVLGAAGAMVSTLDDARVWAEVLATGSLLQPATQQDRLEGGPLAVGPPYDLYALGVGETGGWRGHNGEGLGTTAAVFHHPGSGATIVAFVNISNLESGAHPADQLFRRLAEAIETP